MYTVFFGLQDDGGGAGGGGGKRSPCQEKLDSGHYWGIKS